MSGIGKYFEENFSGQECGRSFRKFISVDPESQHTRNNLKSSTVIANETLRHVLYHRNVIHCYSRFRYFWEILMMATYGMAFVFIPCDVAFCYGSRRLLSSPFLTVVISFIDIVCLMDVAINFRTSYQDHQTKRAVLEGGKIAMHYIRFYFWVDLLSSFPDRIVATWLIPDKKDLIKGELSYCVNDDHLMASPQCLWDFVVILSLLKFLQLPLFFKYLINYLEHRNRSNYFIKIVRNFLAVFFIFHLMVCLVILSERIFPTNFKPQNYRNVMKNSTIWEDTNDFEKYIICFFYTTYTITLFASSIEERSQIEMTVAVIFTLIGFVVHIWMLSWAYTFLKTICGTSIRFHEIRYQIRKYIAFKRLSTTVQERVVKFYDFSFSGNFYRKRQIIELLGNELCQSVTVETCSHLLRENYFFKQLPDELLNSMANCMSEVVFLANDVVCKVDSANRVQKLFLIVSGTVAVYTEDGNEVAHLNDANMFGEIAFLLHDENYPSLNYVATEETVLLVLTRSDFMKILADTPELLAALRQSVKKRFRLSQSS